MRNCVINPRVSTTEQGLTGYSLEAQDKLLNEYCQRIALNVAGVFSVSETASRLKQRKEFEAMMKFMKQKRIKILVMEKVDRLTRNMKDAVMINDWLEADAEREVHFVKDALILHKKSSSQERLNWNIKVVLAQNYIENLSEEVIKGQREKLAQGWLPTMPPLGYMTVGDKGKKTHIINPRQAPFVREMFELYSTGQYSYVKLEKVMWQKGLRTTKGKKVTRSRIGVHLSNPFYIGQNVWKGKTYTGAQETFISKHLFQQVQKVRSRSAQDPNYAKHNHLFAKLITCNNCQRPICWEKQRTRTYGRCHAKKVCKKPTYFRQDKLIAQVAEILQDFKFTHPGFKNWLKEALVSDHELWVQDRGSRTRELDKQENKIVQRLDTLYMDKLDGRISAERYDRLCDEFKAEKANLLEERKKLSANEQKYKDTSVLILELTSKADEIFLKSKDVFRQRRLIELMFSKIYVNNDEVFFELTRTFKSLKKLAQMVNCSNFVKNEDTENSKFEHPQSPYFSTQKAPFGASCPVLLPLRDAIRAFNDNCALYDEYQVNIIKQLLKPDNALLPSQKEIKISRLI